MDYKDIARKVGRSPTTVRKWCPRITELSGYQFTFKKVYRGRNKEPLKQFVFTNDDLTALFPRQVREQDSFNSPINQ